jgi:hypothetical protein
MWTFLWRLPLALILCCAASHGLAQANANDETALARQVFEEVNRQLPGMGRVALVAKRPDVEYKSSLRAWSDKSGLRKIEATDRDDDGNVITEYYFADGALVFAYVATQGFDKGNRPVTRNEDRQYFRSGKMFRWLAGKEKTPRPPASPDFIEEGRSRAAAARFFAEAVARAGKAGAR